MNTIFRYRTWDLTEYFQAQTHGLTEKGALRGTGRLTPVPSALQVRIDPFTIFSNDGLVVESDAYETVTVQNDPLSLTKNYVCLYARRFADNTHTTSLMNLTASEYAAHTDPDHLVVLATVLIPAAQAFVAVGDIYYSEAHHVDPNTWNQFRGEVGNIGALPAVNENRPYDIYWVDGEKTFYYWDHSGSAWYPIFTGAYPLANGTDRVLHINANDWNSPAAAPFSYTLGVPISGPDYWDSVGANAVLIAGVDSSWRGSVDLTSIGFELDVTAGTNATDCYLQSEDLSDSADPTKFPAVAMSWTNIATVTVPALTTGRVLAEVAPALTLDFTSKKYRLYIKAGDAGVKVYGAHLIVDITNADQ